MKTVRLLLTASELSGILGNLALARNGVAIEGAARTELMVTFTGNGESLDIKHARVEVTFDENQIQNHHG